MASHQLCRRFRRELLRDRRGQLDLCFIDVAGKSGEPINDDKEDSTYDSESNQQSVALFSLHRTGSFYNRNANHCGWILSIVCLSYITIPQTAASKHVVQAVREQRSCSEPFIPAGRRIGQTIY